MIERVEQYGAFIHIGDHIALPHARPEDGVNEVGMHPYFVYTVFRTSMRQCDVVADVDKRTILLHTFNHRFDITLLYFIRTSSGVGKFNQATF